MIETRATRSAKESSKSNYQRTTNKRQSSASTKKKDKGGSSSGIVRAPRKVVQNSSDTEEKLEITDSDSNLELSDGTSNADSSLGTHFGTEDGKSLNSSFETETENGRQSFHDRASFSSQMDQTTVPNGRNKLAVFVVLMAMVVGLGLAAWQSSFFMDSEVSSRSSSNDMIQQFNLKLKSLTNDFGQDEMLLRQAKIALVNHKRTPDNRQPAVLMLAADQNAYPTAGCLANKYAALYSMNCRMPASKVSGKDVKDLSASEAKQRLDKELTEHFESGACAVVVDRLDLIPAEATKVFYQFCENDNAPFKNVAIIFALQVENGDWTSSPQDLSNLPPKLWDQTVDKFLHHSLQSRDPETMTDDMIGGLLSRITPAVAWVRKANSLTC